MSSTDVTQDESPLIRGMGPAALTAVSINATIGSGIFGLPGSLAALAGSYSVLVIVACGHLKRRLNSLTGSTNWVELTGTGTCYPLWGGNAQLDTLLVDGPGGH